MCACKLCQCKLRYRWMFVLNWMSDGINERMNECGRCLAFRTWTLETYHLVRFILLHSLLLLSFDTARERESHWMWEQIKSYWLQLIDWYNDLYVVVFLCKNSIQFVSPAIIHQIHWIFKFMYVYTLCLIDY